MNQPTALSPAMITALTSTWSDRDVQRPWLAPAVPRRTRDALRRRGLVGDPGILGMTLLTESGVRARAAAVDELHADALAEHQRRQVPSGAGGGCDESD